MIMREIKFRAWDKKRKVIVNPDKFYLDINYIYVNNKDGSGYWIKEDDYVLMQYTGLKDKNNKEIYEGDIVKIIYSMSWMKIPEIIVEQVKLVNGAFMPFYWLRKDEDYEIDYLVNLATVEVVGNVFENPELLNRKVKQG